MVCWSASSIPLEGKDLAHKSKPVLRLFITLIVIVALGVFAVILFPLLLMALVTAFAIRTLKRWRETDFGDDEFE
jgi:hypothetical protein